MGKILKIFKGEYTMKRIAKFNKVSEEQFKKDWKNTFGDECSKEWKKFYDRVTLPERATSGSAGYDFVSPLGFSLAPGESIKIPTGVRARMDEGWVLKLYPRSGLGFKYRLQLNNTVGIIDSDYFNAANEGHIFIKITNDSNEDKTLTINAGDKIVQGIFIRYGITKDDNAKKIRNGGFGSTD